MSLSGFADRCARIAGIFAAICAMFIWIIIKFPPTKVVCGLAALFCAVIAIVLTVVVVAVRIKIKQMKKNDD